MELLLEQLKLSVLDNEAKRLFHGRGKCFLGLEQVTVDWFSPAIFITVFQQQTAYYEQGLVDTVHQALPDFTGVILLQRRYIHGAPVEVIQGELPSPHVVMENGIKYQVKLLDGQNNGLFLDMANGRRWISEHAHGRNVLNLFSYSCSFSLAAMQGGAANVVNIDMSHGALKLGKTNHKINEMPTERVKFLRHDIFKSWGKLKRLGPYETIVFDPPTNQVGSFTASKDYAKLLRKVPALACDGADLLVCLNAPDLGKSFIDDLIQAELPTATCVGVVENPAVFKEIDSDKGLKVYHYRYHIAKEPEG